ncbi:MAG: thiamine pyrophosphate-binding protein [Burkholderiales bacterium]
MPKLRGADILAQSLQRGGVSKVFSLSGNHVMPVFDAAIDAKLDIVHVRHEGAATHMADAYGRLTGEPGVCLFTGGPGHANAVGPLFTALGAESPVVMISGHAPLNALGIDAFQELRQAEMAAPACKASWTIQRVDQIGADVAKAMRIAKAGRPGPVHLSFPTDLMESTETQDAGILPNADAFNPASATLDDSIAGTVLDALATARRPLIITGPTMGNGRGRVAREAMQSVTGIPVLYMESPRGIADPSLGAVAEVLARADLVLMLGKKFDFTVQFGRAPAFDSTSRFIQIDPDPEAIRRATTAIDDRRRIMFATCADAILSAEKLIAIAMKRRMAPTAWTEDVQAALRFRPDSWGSIVSREGAIHALDIGRALRAVIDRTPRVTYVSDGGESSQWSQACVEEQAAARITNGPGGAIGGGVAFAIAAKVARPDGPVLLTIGDGSFGFHAMEYETAVRRNIPFVAIVANDACWNAEYQIQLRTYGRDRAIGCEMLQSRYDQMVVALGGYGELVTKASDLPGALDRALASGRPACLNVTIERIAAPTFSRLAGKPSVSDAS